jgi:hypothetical protein
MWMRAQIANATPAHVIAAPTHAIHSWCGTNLSLRTPNRGSSEWKNNTYATAAISTLLAIPAPLSPFAILFAEKLEISQ